MPCFLIAQVGHLKVGQPEVAVACCFSTHQGQVRRALLLYGRGRRTALDAVVGDLLMGHVSGFFARHVTAAAVRLIGVVLGNKGWGTMAGKAAASEVGDPLLGGGRGVRIVTGGTGKPVPALSLALALQERFPLAGRPSLRAQFSRVDKVSHIIGRFRPGTKAARERPGALTVVSPSR